MKTQGRTQQEAHALILGQGINALGVLRNLGRAGIKAYCIAEKDSFAFKSKYCERSYIDKTLFNDESHLLEVLINVAEQIKAPLFCIIPCSDDGIDKLDRIRNDLPEIFKSNLPNRKNIELFINKGRFYQMLHVWGVPHPRTYCIEDKASLKETLGKIRYPVFLKPLESHKFRRHFEGLKGFTCYSSEEVLRQYQRAEVLNIPLLLQEIVTGGSDHHYFIDGYVGKDGQVKALLARKRIHMYPPFWGNSTSMVSIDAESIQPAIDHLFTILEKSGLRGIFSAEVKYDERDADYKFIEINIRSWWYNIFPLLCGLPLIKIAFDDMIGRKVEPMLKYQTNKRMTYAWPELKAVYYTLRNNGSGMINLFSHYYKTIHGPIFAIDDLKPLLHRTIELFHNKRFNPESK